MTRPENVPLQKEMLKKDISQKENWHLSMGLFQFNPKYLKRLLKGLKWYKGTNKGCNNALKKGLTYIYS